ASTALVNPLVASAFAIAFYYGLTGFACAIYFRRELLKSVKNFIYIGVLPVIGGAMLTFFFVYAVIASQNPDNDSTSPILGIGTPVFIGVGSLLLGVVIVL